MPNARGLGLPNEQSYDTSTIPGVVMDDVTGVYWQRDLNASDGYGWPEADRYCKGLVLAGQDDWRLATRLELVSIVDVAAFNPAIDEAAFPQTKVAGFWSGSLHAGAPETAWLVYSKDGYTSFQQFAYLSQARCVRTARPPSASATGAHTVVGADGTVDDTDTALTWKQSSEPEHYTFEAARTRCEGLVYAGHDDWRVPSLTELQTIVDETIVPEDVGAASTTARVDLTKFPDTIGEPYWTSSTYAGDPDLAWFVDFRGGYTSGYHRSSGYLVRCVR